VFFHPSKLTPHKPKKMALEQNLLQRQIFIHVVTDYGQTCGQAFPLLRRSAENTTVTTIFPPKKQKNKAENDLFGFICPHNPKMQLMRNPFVAIPV